MFIGGGRGVNAAGVISNGSVAVDLSKSTVDSQSLGLSGYNYQTWAPNAAFFTTYGGAGGGTTGLKFYGPGFSDTSAVTATVNLQGVGDINSLVTAVNAAIQAAGNGGTPQAAAFSAANIVASADTAGHINFTSSSSAFMVGDDTTAASQNLLSGASASVYGYAQGTDRQTTTGLTWQASLGAADTQKMTIQADSNGTLQKIDITLPNLETMAGALTYINSQLQGSNLSSLQSIVAVQDGAGTIGFTSTKAFNLTINAATTAAKGFTAPAGTLSASVPGADTLANASVASASSAQAAVTSLSGAVAAQGKAQAVVGKGENQFNYAINLAQSQNTNLAAAESRIRDADLAAEAANLTKAQILLQAGVAAVAQANTSSQSVLALLK